jgi:hypothetical protein
MSPVLSHPIRAAARRVRSLNALLVGAVVVLVMLLVSGAATAGHPHHAHAVPAPPTNPTRANQIQNIDQVKTAIKAYYGDTVEGTNPDGSPQHTYGKTSAYVFEMRRLEKKAEGYLSAASKHHKPAKGKKAILLDVDDTTLNTYNYEIFSNFVYNPASNATFVNGAAFPAVPGMPGLVKWAKAKGYRIFFLTGRPVTQHDGTVTNLTKVGYPSVPDSHLYLKDLSAPWLSSCATTTPVCTTIQYKSLTRKHIESQGYDIVANFGDQFSDLKGGFADKVFKLPNPMYYLP